MEDNNTGLFHYFFFAIAAVVLVYAGEQVKCHPDPITICWMKFAAVEAALSIVSMGVSFVPATLNEKYANKRKTAETVAEQWFSFEVKPLGVIDRKYVRLIQQQSIECGRYEALQNVHHKWTQLFNAVAWTLLLLSAIMFAIGVCAL